MITCGTCCCSGAEMAKPYWKYYMHDAGWRSALVGDVVGWLHCASVDVNWPLRWCVHVTVTDTWFPALRCRSRIRFRNRVRTCRSICRCWGACAAVARQAHEAGRRVFRAKEWAELQASWYVRNGRYGKIELDPV